MRVGTKLIIGFLCIAILGAVVATIGIYNMGRMNDKAAEMYHKELLGLSYIKEANISLIYAGRARGNVLLATTTEERDLNTANIKKYLVEVNAYLDKAKPLFVTERAKEIYAQYHQVSESYEAEMAKALALASKENLQSYSDELKKYLENSRRYADTMDNLLSELAQQKEARAKTASEETATLYESSFALMSALVLCSLAAGIALGFLITRNLTRQLGGEPHYAADIAARIASGDLSVDVETKTGDQTSLLYAMKKMRESLATVVAHVRTGTDTIASASTQIASGNQDLSSRTEEQASSLEETASSMEELTSTVKQNADNARQANSLAEAATNVATKGGDVISQVVRTMDEINDSASRIVDIIGVIDGIAFQTNILALNAAVEAARAGEQGRGFAVVASEVRNLAQRSAAAAKEIKSLIGDSVEKVENGSKLVNEAGSTMTEIVASVKRVTDIMSEITAASQEQTAGIEQINLAITQMDEVTQQNAALVEEAAAAAEAMQEQAGKLSEVVSVFKVHGMPQLSSQAGDARLKAAQGVVTAVPRPNKQAVVSNSSKPAIPARRQVAMTSTKDDWEEF